MIRFSIALALFLASAAHATPTTVLPIGDSITQGGGAPREYSYRWALARMLSDEGMCVDFIGTRTGGLHENFEWPSTWDADHEGYYGATTEFVRKKLKASLPNLPEPDIALVHLGVNDQGDNTLELRHLIGDLRKANPRVTVLIAQIRTRFIRSLYLRFRVKQLATELSTKTSVILAVDHYSDWNLSRDTLDGVHPSPRGQRKMAERWLEAMRPYLTPTVRCAGKGK